MHSRTDSQVTRLRRSAGVAYACAGRTVPTAR
jgi:hypothetical protein